ncbi:MAG: nucleotide-binding protein [candidate division KSB1 bacterium]|nr:nucleotide-binding protein [candidate division KSB1 bacterium]MDZ7275569.1 nucleotide-binding protein [candidate division KSB1 bacterium]MDZ7286119.1 nucleotide-binding protein [candidate division KSB1 bacterium]MDZ7296345.1 nucleotide-binding protein [candidate division KSB1 bacterium]MDZ7347212.1 nucleotide-binding protein [candidate division KSB1 bacterium]
MSNWDVTKIAEILNGNNIQFQRKSIQNGEQLLLDDGSILCVYNTGRLVWQGKETPLKKKIQELIGADKDQEFEQSSLAYINKSSMQLQSNKVFIVYGHDTQAREQLELLLRRLKLEPIVLQNVVSVGQTVIEKLESNTEVNFACVLLTPDDEGHRIDHPEEKKRRARQNVVLEMGMFLAKLGRKRVAILMKGDLEKPSDIEGLLYIKFEDSVFDVKDKLAAELQEAGFKINIKDLLN